MADRDPDNLPGRLSSAVLFIWVVLAKLLMEMVAATHDPSIVQLVLFSRVLRPTSVAQIQEDFAYGIATELTRVRTADRVRTALHNSTFCERAGRHQLGTAFKLHDAPPSVVLINHGTTLHVLQTAQQAPQLVRSERPEARPQMR